MCRSILIVLTAGIILVAFAAVPPILPGFTTLNLSGSALAEKKKQARRVHRMGGGGGAKSRLWLQIHADILGQPIHVPRDSEACALGSAMIAAVHTGHYPNLDAAARNMVQIAGLIEPGQENKDVYDAYYARYLATYPALKELMHGLA